MNIRIGRIFSFFVICLLLAIVFIFFEGNRELRLVGYSQQNEKFELEFNKTLSKASVIRLADVPLEIVINKSQGEPLPSTVDGNVVRFEIDLSKEPIDHEYSILLFIDHEWLELVRQSPSWLNRMFSYDRSEGYTLLGRRSINVPHEMKGELPILNFKKLLPLKIEEMGTSPFREIRLATGLLKFLWSQPISQGPTKKSYDNFVNLSLGEKIEALRKGEFAVMCTGFRDLFLHASVGVPELKIRGVEAYNYSPQFPDLITYGHSTAEIWIEDLNRWVLFDPWLAIMILDEDNLPIGSEKIHGLNLRIAEVIDELPRLYQRGDGRIIETRFDPLSLSLDKPVCLDVGCIPGYRSYFEVVVKRNHMVQ